MTERVPFWNVKLVVLRGLHRREKSQSYIARSDKDVWYPKLPAHGYRPSKTEISPPTNR